MNSLVVFLSVVALVAGKPSGLITSPIISTPLAYAAPAYYSAPALYAAPAAVSSQSRLDIKSSPAVVTTSIEPIARTVISEPAVISPPTILPAPIAPAAVSSQSRIDIKTSPAITSTVVSAPVAYSAPLALAYKAPTFVKTFAPAFSAAIAAPAVPLDTPEVIAARAEHFEAKVLAGAHLIKKRSAPLIAAPVLSHLASPVISTYAAAPVVHAPLAYSAPIAISTPLITKAYSVHPW